MSKEVLIEGKVVHGKKLGTRLGFPTINVEYNGSESGVFVGEIYLNDKWCEAVIHVGGKPTIGDEKSVCEANVLNFDKAVEKEIFSGKKLMVKFLYKIRDTKKFPTLEELKEKISQDVEFAKNWYNQRKL